MKNNPLSNVPIACSGFEEPELSELIQKIQKLGGKFDANLKKSTTYLISNKINTDKCLVGFYILLKFYKYIIIINYY